MYDDYDLDYTFSNDYNLDEDACEYYMLTDAHDLDEDYARDTQDYDALAYRHYAWYDLVHICTRIMHATYAHKRLVRVTLDVMCYDDLDLEGLNWRELLQLEPSEDVDISIKEPDVY